MGRYSRSLALLLVVAVPAAAAGDFGRSVRALRADDRDRRRAALEAFARGDVVPDGRRETRKAFTALERFLDDRFPGTERALAVRGLGRLDDRRVFEALVDWLEEERDDRVLAAAAEVFAGGPEELAGELADEVQAADDPVLRAILLRMLGALPGEEARRRIRLRARMADHWCPRAAAIHALARDRDPEALARAVAVLRDDDPALVTAAVETLTKLTGERFGRDVVKWRAWWSTREAVAPIEEAMEEAGKGERRTTARPVERKTIAGHFFGIPIEGEEVVFVFDVSASMRYKLPIAYQQLVNAVKSLPSTATFEVVFFNEFVWPWRGRMSTADPASKELLLRHLPTIEIKSYTNLFDSLEKALALEPDEIFVISDGAPNRGRKQFPDAIRKELEKLNRRRTRINTVSVVRVVDGEEHIELLAGIAADHSGTHVQRTLK